MKRDLRAATLYHHYIKRASKGNVKENIKIHNSSVALLHHFRSWRVSEQLIIFTGHSVVLE